MTTTRPSPIRTSSDDRPVLRIRTPAEICEVLPFLVGFEPSQSLVAVSLRGPRRRLGLTARVDLPAEPTLAGALADDLAAHLLKDGAAAALVVAYADDHDPDPDPFVQALRKACERSGIGVLEALLVRDGRWTSYTCDAVCCPPSGTPVRDRVGDPGALTAAMIADGRQVQSGRADLAASVSPATGLLAAAMADRLQRELDGYVTAMTAPEGGDAYREETVALARSLIERSSRGEPLAVDASARLIVGLIDRAARDDCLPAMISRPSDAPDAAVGARANELWHELTRRAVVPGSAAPVATLLAACSYLDHGDGALANVALDRALADDPGYVLALHLRGLLDHGVPPSTLRRWIEDSSGGLAVGDRSSGRSRKRPAPRRRHS